MEISPEWSIPRSFHRGPRRIVAVVPVQVLLNNPHLTGFPEIGGAEEDRTPDLRIANATLSQLSYGPIRSKQFTLQKHPKILASQTAVSCLGIYVCPSACIRF